MWKMAVRISFIPYISFLTFRSSDMYHFMLMKGDTWHAMWLNPAWHPLNLLPRLMPLRFNFVRMKIYKMEIRLLLIFIGIVTTKNFLSSTRVNFLIKQKYMFNILKYTSYYFAFYDTYNVWRFLQISDAIGGEKGDSVDFLILSIFWNIEAPRVLSRLLHLISYWVCFCPLSPCLLSNSLTSSPFLIPLNLTPIQSQVSFSDNPIRNWSNPVIRYAFSSRNQLVMQSLILTTLRLFLILCCVFFMFTSPRPSWGFKSVCNKTVTS